MLQLQFAQFINSIHLLVGKMGKLMLPWELQIELLAEDAVSMTYKDV